RNRDVPKILLAAAVGVDPEADRALARFYTSCRDRLAQALRTGRELGIVGHVDPQPLAICIMGTLKEYLFGVLMVHDPPGGPGVGRRPTARTWSARPTRRRRARASGAAPSPSARAPPTPAARARGPSARAGVRRGASAISATARRRARGSRRTASRPRRSR